MQTLSLRKDLLEESYHVYCVWLAESLFCYYICCCNVLSSAGCILLYKDAHMAAHKGLPLLPAPRLPPAIAQRLLTVRMKTIELNNLKDYLYIDLCT